MSDELNEVQWLLVLMGVAILAIPLVVAYKLGEWWVWVKGGLKDLESES